MDFMEQLEKDSKDIFLNGEFSQKAIYKSATTIKEIDVQFFKDSLDRMGTLYSHAWCSISDVPYLRENDTLEIDGVVYGVVDFTSDNYNGVDIFLNEV
jgi:hypothetical protein